MNQSQPPADGNENIEFNCSQCGTLLRVPAAFSGRNARCPQCQAVELVPPASTATASAPVAEPSPPTGASVGVPPAPSTPFDNPVSPGAAAPTPQQPASAPATGGISAPNVGPSTGNTPLSQFPNTPEAAPPSSMPKPGQETMQVGTNLSHLMESSGKYESRDTATKQLFEKIINEISKIYVGQDELVLGTLVALFSSGHVLIESVPGLGKTLFVRTLGKILGCDFGRIQFTADLMPSDVTGAPIFNIKEQEFNFRPGPVFTQLLLADEINRSPAKTHASLLEIMQEYRVTVDGTSHPLKRPFLVIATQNPVESEGTYNLPEAQLDRFMFKLVADYPNEQEEARILEMHSQQVDIGQRLDEEIETVTSGEEIVRITEENGNVRIDPKLVQYINRLVRLTREWPQFHLGASPRAGLALMQAARTLAAFCGRDYAIPDDVVQIAIPVLRHRVILTAEAEVEQQSVDTLLTDMIRTVEVPRL